MGQFIEQFYNSSNALDDAAGILAKKLERLDLPHGGGDRGNPLHWGVARQPVNGDLSSSWLLAACTTVDSKQGLKQLRERLHDMGILKNGKDAVNTCTFRTSGDNIKLWSVEIPMKKIDEDVLDLRLQQFARR